MIDASLEDILGFMLTVGTIISVAIFFTLTILRICDTFCPKEQSSDDTRH